MTASLRVKIIPNPRGQNSKTWLSKFRKKNDTQGGDRHCEAMRFN